jgi:putative transposase
MVAIDPGVRTFATFFSPSLSGKLGEGHFSRIYRLLLNLDELYSQRAKANKRKKKSLTKAIRRLSAKIRNLISEMHWKVARFLCERFSVILLPTYENKNKNTLEDKPAMNWAVKGTTAGSKRKLQCPEICNRRI